MPALVAHADWSMDARKRWITVLRRAGPGWTLTAPRLVGDVRSLPARLMAEAAGGAVALGADLPIGLPRAYAATRPEPDFRAFLRSLGSLGSMPRFFDVCAVLEDVRPDRPFYPARGLAGMTRLSHALALGLPDAAALSRLCDRATAERPAGAPLFWTLGANQSGKAAIAAWRDLILPNLDAAPADAAPADAAPRLALWPFDGPFRALLRPGTVVLAETYPAEALRHLRLRLSGSKRRQADRAAIAAPLLRAARALGAEPDDAMRALAENGFGADAAGEDRFDSTLGALCVLNVVLGRRPDHVPDDAWLARWEGWVLGQTALPSPRA
ncbi:hypothetical protein [Rhodopila sp.]|jgi:hypothetical protein|uniref:hypothetical protein n=1 Tax=Rhodopila sp. TaxID=2480087 RepID=UPI002C335280|nr:hypothetical protein [Rhodopila sp.]HVZ08752.1 hypothetical protein [Rhodopila sp.]